MFDTNFIGTTIVKLQSVDSTNNYAANLIKSQKTAPGTVILAHEQTQGKGQRGNQWHTEAGKNLTFSLILYPVFLSTQQGFELSKITALALSDVLEEMGINNHIKWPNDIYVNTQKIAGILIENSFQGNKIASSIIGIGLNVNQVFDQSFNATSLSMLTHQQHDLMVVLDRFCLHFQKWYNLLELNKTQFIHNSYLLRLFRFGQLAQYVYMNQTINAVITNVDETGKLVLSTTEQETILADIKEISFVI